MLGNKRTFVFGETRCSGVLREIVHNKDGSISTLPVDFISVDLNSNKRRKIQTSNDQRVNVAPRHDWCALQMIGRDTLRIPQCAKATEVLAFLSRRNPGPAAAPIKTVRLILGEKSCSCWLHCNARDVIDLPTVLDMLPQCTQLHVTSFFPPGGVRDIPHSFKARGLAWRDNLTVFRLECATLTRLAFPLLNQQQMPYTIHLENQSQMWLDKEILAKISEYFKPLVSNWASIAALHVTDLQANFLDPLAIMTSMTLGCAAVTDTLRITQTTHKYVNPLAVLSRVTRFEWDMDQATDAMASVNPWRWSRSLQSTYRSAISIELGHEIAAVAHLSCIHAAVTHKRSPTKLEMGQLMRLIVVRLPPVKQDEIAAYPAIAALGFIIEAAVARPHRRPLYLHIQLPVQICGDSVDKLMSLVVQAVAPATHHKASLIGASPISMKSDNSGSGSSPGNDDDEESEEEPSTDLSHINMVISSVMPSTDGARALGDKIEGSLQRHTARFPSVRRISWCITNHTRTNLPVDMGVDVPRAILFPPTYDEAHTSFHQLM